jgi:hypothetical protein
VRRTKQPVLTPRQGHPTRLDPQNSPFQFELQLLRVTLRHVLNLLFEWICVWVQVFGSIRIALLPFLTLRPFNGSLSSLLVIANAGVLGSLVFFFSWSVSSFGPPWAHFVYAILNISSPIKENVNDERVRLLDCG